MGKTDTTLSTFDLCDSAARRTRRRSGCRRLSRRIHDSLSETEGHRGAGETPRLAGHDDAAENLAADFPGASAANPDQHEQEATSIRDETPLPDEKLLLLEEQQRIRTAVSLLDERCQTLLQMLFYRREPPSYAEIAASLRIPEGSIGPTRARCLGKLLRLLGK